MRRPTAVTIRSGMAWVVMFLAPAWVGLTHGDESDRGAECVQIADDGTRLACYDRAFARWDRGAPQPPAAAPGSMPAATAVAADVAPSATPAELAESFGAEDLPRENVEPETQLDSLEARVVDVQADRRGKHVYRLDNGQTWQQVEVTDLVSSRVGDTVRISRGAFDSYRMRRADGGRTVTVRRTN